MISSKQQGVALSSLIAYLAIGGFLALIGIRAVPMYSEYSSIKRIVNTIESSGTSEVSQARKDFDKLAAGEYVESINSKDIEVRKTDGGVHISFSYERRIELLANVSLVFDFTKN